MPLPLPRALLALPLAVLPCATLALELDAPGLRDGGPIPMAHVNATMGCTGLNISPALTWTNPPAGTQSFAVSIHDPDAPTGSGWWHWVVFDIPATTRALAAGESGHLSAPALESRTDFGTPGYGGPCPPQGAAPHRYIIRIHALDVPTLGLDAEAMPALVGYLVNAHSLGSASLTALYGR